MPKQDQVAIRVFMPPELRDTFKAVCTLKRSTMNDVTVSLIEGYIEQNKALLPKEEDGLASLPESLKQLIRDKYFYLMNSGKIPQLRLKQLGFTETASKQERKIISDVLGIPLENLPK